MGIPRLTVLLRREGWLINRKQVHRPDKEEGLERKRRRCSRTGGWPWGGKLNPETLNPSPAQPPCLRSMRSAYGAASSCSRSIRGLIVSANFPLISEMKQ